ncbi:heme utilization protein [Pseudomonas sp. JQ170]|uniref:heme utilization protein n=1 Tax=unclassified Pseudomonas TaxID=196821 RepID=UPI00264F5CFF|nr:MULTISPECIES: heme utilization protein [unclassified Pseudomonas]MDN7139985.1 heme utilization protein [Pseudomonas sp. JQ170]WRO78652.1 heme utilization protein [Pseudomonas sp. 170C]
MKPSMALKPLVFAIAAVMAVAVQAGQNDRRGNDHHHNNGHHHGGHQTPPPTKVYVTANAGAYDEQNSEDNKIRNEGTINGAAMTDSAEGTSGNVGVNVAAGAGNQQDNAAAIANAGSNIAELDNSFVFGTANATASVNQYSDNNKVNNYGSTNSALMSGSASGGSGNIGINVAGGDLNQQKNTMAIANSNAPLGNANATASAVQDGPGLEVNNNADRTYNIDTITITTTATGSSFHGKASAAAGSNSQSSSWEAKGASGYKVSGKQGFEAEGMQSQKAGGSFDASLKAHLDVDAEASRTVSWDYGRHHNGERTNSVEGSLEANLDASVKGKWNTSSGSEFSKSFGSSFEKEFESSFEKSGSQKSESEYEHSKGYAEVSAYNLSNSISFQVLTPTGWANPVTNTAVLAGSVNGGSGNLGVNVAAGVGNQQSNSLAISNTSM